MRGRQDHFDGAEATARKGLRALPFFGRDGSLLPSDFGKATARKGLLACGPPSGCHSGRLSRKARLRALPFFRKDGSLLPSDFGKTTDGGGSPSLPQK